MAIRQGDHHDVPEGYAVSDNSAGLVKAFHVVS